MAQCIVVDDAASGALRTSDADPCTTFVLMTPAEYSAVSTSPFNLTVEQGGLIGSAILLVWAAAWGWRQLEDVISDRGSDPAADNHS